MTIVSIGESHSQGNDIGFILVGNYIGFRGAPSGYFGESSAGTFNPSWYLNDLGTMYKRVSCLILIFEECYLSVIFQNASMLGNLKYGKLLPGFLPHTFPIFQGPSFIPAYSTERCVGNGSPCLYRAGLVREVIVDQNG